MGEYRLNFIKNEGKYQVSYHDEMQFIKVSDFASLINRTLFEDNLFGGGLFEEEPTFTNLSEQEENALKSIRLLILDKRRLESLVCNDSDIPF